MNEQAREHMVNEDRLRLARIEKLAIDRASGGYITIPVQDLQYALYGAEKPAEPKLTTFDVDMAWDRYQKVAAEAHASNSLAWGRYLDVLKKWRSQQ